MLEKGSNLLFIFSTQDFSQASEIMKSIMEDEHIQLLAIEANGSNEEDAERKIENAKVIAVLATNHSRKDEKCTRLVKCAHDYNKNFAIIGYHDGGLGNGQSWVNNEWQLNEEPFAWLDPDSKAELMAQLRDWLGKEQIAGSRVGAHITFKNTSGNNALKDAVNFHLYQKKDSEFTEIQKVENVQTTEFRLEKGTYLYAFTAATYENKVRIGQEFKVDNNSDHQNFSASLDQVLDDYIKFCADAQTKKDTLSQLLRHLKTTTDNGVRNYENQKRRIENDHASLGEISNTALGLIVILAGIIAIAYMFLPYCYDTGIGSIARYASAAITTISYPLIILFNLPYFSWTFFIVMGVLALLFYIGSPDGKRGDNAGGLIGILTLIKFGDYFLYGGFNTYGQRRLIAGFVMSFIFFLIIYGIYYLLKLLCRRILKGFLTDYYNYKEEPYRNNSNYLKDISNKLKKLHGLTPEELNTYYNEDSILTNEIEKPLYDYQKQPKYTESIAFFPIKRLIISIFLLAMVIAIVVILGYLLITGYHQFIEKLLNFSIDNI